MKGTLALPYNVMLNLSIDLLDLSEKDLAIPLV